jgi:hypothetical protein
MPVREHINLEPCFGVNRGSLIAASSKGYPTKGQHRILVPELANEIE